MEAMNLSGLPESERLIWKSLYRSGGVAALLSVLFFPIQIAVFLVSPPPETVTGWFELFQVNPLVGLLDLDLLIIADEVCVIIMVLALYVALRRTNESWMAIGTVLAIGSAFLFIATNPAGAMFSLSSQYTAAATDAQRAVFLAAGQAMLAVWQGSGFQSGYILGSVASIIVSIVMVKSRLFSKATGYMGILANVISMGLYVPTIGVYISVFSVVFLWIWYIMIARGLFRLAKSQDTVQGG